MAGGLLAWSQNDAPPDSARWRQSVVGAVRYGGDVVREIWNAHLDGADHSRQLSGLVAIELFAQLMVDGDTT